MDYDLTNLVGRLDNKPETESTEDEIKEEVLKGEANFLAICSDSTGEFTISVLINVSLDARLVKVVPIDPNISCRANDFEGTLYQHYSHGGINQLVPAIENINNISIARYVSCSEDDFKRLIRLLGDVSVNVRKDISISNDIVILELKAGVQKLSPDALLKYLKYADTGKELQTIQAEAISAMLKGYMTKDNISKGEDLFNSIINLVESNVSIIDYNSNKAILEAFVKEEITFSVAGVTD